jgi:hypothetical protein
MALTYNLRPLRKAFFVILNNVKDLIAVLINIFVCLVILKERSD